MTRAFDEYPEHERLVLYWFKHTGYAIGTYHDITDDLLGDGEMVDIHVFRGRDGWLTDEDVYWTYLDGEPEVEE